MMTGQLAKVIFIMGAVVPQIKTRWKTDPFHVYLDMILQKDILTDSE